MVIPGRRLAAASRCTAAMLSTAVVRRRPTNSVSRNVFIPRYASENHRWSQGSTAFLSLACSVAFAMLLNLNNRNAPVTQKSNRKWIPNLGGRASVLLPPPAHGEGRTGAPGASGEPGRTSS